MSISVENLKEIGYDFSFFEKNFYSNPKREQDRWGFICNASFALSEYSGSGKSTGEWISVKVKEDSVEVIYKTDGIAGNSDSRISLPADATKNDIKQAIERYV